jgi:hypothetical protein
MPFLFLRGQAAVAGDTVVGNRVGRFVVGGGTSAITMSSTNRPPWTPIANPVDMAATAAAAAAARDVEGGRGHNVGPPRPVDSGRVAARGQDVAAQSHRRKDGAAELGPREAGPGVQRDVEVVGGRVLERQCGESAPHGQVGPDVVLGLGSLAIEKTAPLAASESTALTAPDPNTIP